MIRINLVAQLLVFDLVVRAPLGSEVFRHAFPHYPELLTTRFRIRPVHRKFLKKILLFSNNNKFIKTEV